jgi:hypothetical protein
MTLRIVTISLCVWLYVSGVCIGQTRYNPYESQKTFSTAQKPEAQKAVPLDSQGRPMFDSEGRMITYPEKSKDGPVYPNTYYSPPSNYKKSSKSKYDSDPNPDRYIRKGVVR